MPVISLFVLVLLICAVDLLNLSRTSVFTVLMSETVMGLPTMMCGSPFCYYLHFSNTQKAKLIPIYNIKTCHAFNLFLNCNEKNGGCYFVRYFLSNSKLYVHQENQVDAISLRKRKEEKKHLICNIKNIYYSFSICFFTGLQWAWYWGPHGVYLWPRWDLRWAWWKSTKSRSLLWHQEASAHHV